MAEYQDLENKTAAHDRSPDAPPVQFLLGEAMVSQKKQRKHASDLVQIKELLAEIQIYVQKHHQTINQDLVDHTQMKISIESLRNEMEIRYELALKQFYDKMKMQMSGFVEKEELNTRLYEKLHKREFEKHFDRLNSTCSYLETKVSNAIPAMKYDLDTRLKGKAEQRDLNILGEKKASNIFVEELVKRVNKLEDKVKRGRGGDSSSDDNVSGSGGRSHRSGSISHISEEDEDGSDDEEARRKRKSRKDKILKGSASMEDIKEKKSGLDQIEEEKEASIKSGISASKADLLNNNASDVLASDSKSKGSSRANRHIYPPAGAPVGGMQMSAEGQKEMEAKFEDVYATIEANKDTIEELKTEIAGVRTDMLTKMAGASKSSGPAATSKTDKSALANSDALTKRMNQLEENIKAIDRKYQQEIERMQMLQPVGGTGGGDSDAAGQSAKLMDLTTRRIEAKHNEITKHMKQVDIRVQHALMDIQGLSEHFKNKQQEVFKNITRVGNLRNEVTGKIDAFSKTLQLLHDNFNQMTSRNEDDMNQIKLLINEEMKDMRAANKAFTYELERNQGLFRSMHQELVLTMDEKKIQNDALLENAKEATLAEKKNRRAGSVSIMNAHDKLSFQTLLPQLRVATDTSNAKLTQRQVRIAQLVKGDNFGTTAFGQSGGLLNDPSSLSIKTKIGSNDGIRSTKAFLTSVTPRNDEPNLGFATDNNSPKESRTVLKTGGRKVFGAGAYLERQAKLGLGKNASPPANQPPLEKSEFDAEFNTLHTAMAQSNNQ